jgi:exonuclease VII large subunit
MLPSNANTSAYNTSSSQLNQLKGKALKLNQSAAKLMSNKKNQFVNDITDPTLQALDQRVSEELNQVREALEYKKQLQT